MDEFDFVKQIFYIFCNSHNFPKLKCKFTTNRLKLKLSFDVYRHDIELIPHLSGEFIASYNNKADSCM